MMKALANFVMSGRLQAAIVAVIGFPIISNAAIALVTLRRGAIDGSWLTILAMVPSLVLWMMGLGSAPGLITNFGLLAAIYWGAVILRVTASWQWTLFAAISISALFFAIFYYGFPEVSRELEAVFNEMQQQNRPTGAADSEPAINEGLFLSLFAYSVVVSNILSLILGRWWQALLYNPGGFGGEFLPLRLSPLQAAVCFVLAGICLSRAELQPWAGIALLPLVVASAAMAHQFAAAQGLGKFWLVIFYLALVIVAPFRLGMVLLSFVDSWLDVRGKLLSKTKMPESKESKESKKGKEDKDSEK